MTDVPESDSHEILGGMIPQTPGIHAFRLASRSPSVIPVLIGVPHAGRTYPPALVQALRDPQQAAHKLEDRYVDRLAEVVARETGAGLLVANAPRAMIDLNRAPDDVDWEMFAASEDPDAKDSAPSRRARSGLGVIPRRVPGLGELWKRRHRREELAARIAGIHEPYHAALSGALGQIRARWGVAVLVDLHSMPPIGQRVGQRAPEFVLGDRFGAACHGGLVAAAFSHFNENDRASAHNRPYSGGYVLQRHGAPASGIHAMQIEIDRSFYLDAALSQPGSGFVATASLLSGLVRRIASEAIALTAPRGHGDWREAAE